MPHYEVLSVKLGVKHDVNYVNMPNNNGSDGCVDHMVATPLDVEAPYTNSLGAKSPYAW